MRVIHTTESDSSVRDKKCYGRLFVRPSKSFTLLPEGAMSDGHEEREEQEKRREWEERNDREDRLNHYDEEAWDEEHE
jgi:hypothetical protein